MLDHAFETATTILSNKRVPSYRIATIAGLSGLVILSSAARADVLTQTIDTTSLAFADYDPITKSAGPYPFSNFGVQASATLGADVAVNVQGSTSFTFPTIAVGQQFTANNSILNYAYTPNWADSSISAHAGLSLDSSFVYDIGPFSGNDSIFSAALNPSAPGTITGGTTLTGGSANGFASGPSYNFGLTESAIFASASVGVNVGVNLQTAVTYTPTVQYGYYTWVNTTGLLTAADTPVWHSVASGDLTYAFPSNLAVDAGSETFFLNFLPGVQMDMPISPTATVTVPLTGYLNASAFGDTLAQVNLALGNLYSFTALLDTWDDDVNWNGEGYYSFQLHEDNSACQIHPGPSCETYTVLGDPLFAEQTNFPQNTTQDMTGGGGTGLWNDLLNNPPLLPEACDPATGRCYASNDPNMPVGTGTITTTDTIADAPEPAAVAIFGAGLLLLLGMYRRRDRAAFFG